MKSNLIISALLCLMIIAPSTLCQEINSRDLIAYNKWRFNNKRIYFNDEEQVYRQQVFFQNLKAMNEHNKDKEATYEMGLNQYSDMPNEEFIEKVLNKKLSEKKQNNRLLQNDELMTNKQFPPGPAQIDWRVKGIFNPIQNQGFCRSCWTFSALAGIESFNAIMNKKVEKFSEQYLLDCTNHYQEFPATDGCNGGFQEDAVRFSIRYGLIKASSYPYVGTKAKTCKVDIDLQLDSPGFRPKKFQRLASTSEALKSALTFSPVIATVNADRWQSYRNGVFNNCPEITIGQLNHAVLVVGYDTKGNWIIRNTMGSGWGESGYIRLAAGKTCGILIDNLIITE